MAAQLAPLEAYSYGYDFEEIVITDYNVSFGLTWKNIMFLPFYRPLVYTFIVVMYLSIGISIWVLAFHPVGSFYNDWLYNIATCLDMMFLARTVLALLHRMFREHRKRKIFEPEPYALLVVDVITMLPVGPYCFLINRYNWHDPIDDRIGNFYCAALKLPRVIHLLYLFKKVYGDLSRHPRTLVIFSHFMCSTLIALCLSTLFYTVYFYNPEGKNWGDRFVEMRRTNVSIYTPLLSVLYVGGFFFQNIYVVMPDDATYEEILMVVTMLLSYFAHSVYLTAYLLAVYVQLMRFSHFFEWRLLKVGLFTKLLLFEQGLQDSINTYYRTIWVTREGFVEQPDIVNLFPAQLRTEIAMDLYFDAIRHAKIFENISDAFKKELSLLFSTEVYIPGQFLFQKDKIKGKLVYLHSGIVDVMSNENRDSPVLSFSPGTILGEISALVPYIGTADIRCSTTCVMHVLRHRALKLILARDATLHSHMRHIIRYRVAYARKKLKIHRKLENPISHIYWIKYRWRKLIEVATSSKQEYPPEPLSRYFCSRFMNLLVVSSRYELKVHSICIRGKCSFVMEADSSFRRFLEIFCIVCEVIHFFLTFHMIIFEGGIRPNIYAVLPLFDMVFLLDIYIQTITAVHVHNVFITEPMDILVYKCKQFFFLLDVFAALPYDYFALLMKASPYYVGLCRLPKYIRLYKAMQFLSVHHQLLLLSPRTMKILQSIIIHSFIILFGASLMYTWTCFEGKCSSNGWLTIFKERAQRHLGKPIDTSDFLISLLYTSSIYLRMKNHHILPEITSELLGEAMICLIGFYTVNQTLVQMAGAIALENYPRFLYMIHLNYFESIFQERPELREFRQYIREYITLQWFYTNSMQLNDTIMLMNHKSKFIRHKITHDYIILNLRKTQLFAQISDNFIDLLSNYVSLYVIPAGHTLQIPNSSAADLYVLLDGYCHVHSFAPEDLEKQHDFFYGKYDVFPVVEFFHNVNSFLHIQTYTAVKVLSVPYHHFAQCIKAIRTDGVMLQKALDHHLNDHRNEILRVVHWPVLNYPVLESQDTIIKFKYKTEEKLVKTTENYWRKLNVANFRSYVLWTLTHTYDPHGHYLYYEIFRTLVVLTDMFCLYLSLHRTIRLSDVYDWVMIVLLVLHIIDIFVRSHVQYYTDDGLRVSNTMSTFRYYLTHSFIIDLFSALPYERMQVFDIVRRFPKNWLNVLMSIIIQPLKLYRPLALSLYLRKTIGIRQHNYLLALTYTMLFLICFCQLGAIALVVTCSVNDDWLWECPTDSWLYGIRDYNYWISRDLIYTRALREVITSYLMRSAYFYSYHDFVLFLFIGIVLCALYTWYYASLIGYAAFSSKYYVNAQERHRRYDQLAAAMQFPKALQNELTEHYKYVFKKTRSDEVHNTMLLDFYPNLRESMQLAMYGPTLRESKFFFNVPSEFYRFIGPFFNEHFYIMNAVLLQCNDVNRHIYFIRKGVVEIFVAGQSVAVLGVGGAFGCFSHRGASRANIKVVANVNTDVLVIETTKFIEVVQPYGEIKFLIKVANSTHQEYFEPCTRISRRSTTTLHRKYIRCTFRNWYNYTFDNRNRFIQWYSIFTKMHLASIVGMIALINMSLNTYCEGEWIFWIVTDVYFLFDMYMSCHIGYTNWESGLMVTRVSALTKMYLKSWKFAIDLIAIIPLYMFKRHLVYKHIGLHNLNKALRIGNMVIYYNIVNRTSYVSSIMHFTYLFYLMFYLLTLVVVLITCAIMVYDDAEAEWKTVLNVSVYIANLFSTTGMEGAVLNKVVGFCLIGFSVLFINLVTVLLNTGFCKLAVMLLFCHMEFRRAVIMFKRYCHNEYVSRPSVIQCWYYLMHLYSRHGGEQFSSLIVDSPNYIREAHMAYMAEKVICSHALFKHAHIDFMRQIMRFVRYEFIMPGSTIVEAGDKRKTMYFIADGTVLSVQTNGLNRFFDILDKGGAFGEMQAIKGYRYVITYKALTPVQLFTIKTRDWAYLLKWFPATEYHIMNVARKYKFKTF